MTTETRATEWNVCKGGPWYPSLPHGGLTAYRIWQRTDGLSWQQRHEWMRADGTTEAEGWINGQRGWISDAKPALAA
jgi:hypothetical protein